MKEDHFPVTHTDAEWRAILTPEQYEIMRGHGTERPGSCALLHEKRPGGFRLRGLRAAAVREQDQVRQRHRLAELQYSGRRRDRDDGRPQLWHDAHRSALRALRLASWPRVSRRPAANRPALLHQRRGDKLHAGRVNAPHLPTGSAVARPCRSSGRPERPDRRADREPRHAGGDRLLVDSPLSQGVPLRPPRHRDAARPLAADSAVHSLAAATRQRARL